MKVCDTTPPPTPAVSPSVIGTGVAMLCTGAASSSTFHATGTPMLEVATSTCGMGGIGVLQTSGNPSATPGSWHTASMVALLRSGLARRPELGFQQGGIVFNDAAAARQPRAMLDRAMETRARKTRIAQVGVRQVGGGKVGVHQAG